LNSPFAALQTYKKPIQNIILNSSLLFLCASQHPNRPYKMEMEMIQKAEKVRHLSHLPETNVSIDLIAVAE